MGIGQLLVSVTLLFRWGTCPRGEADEFAVYTKRYSGPLTTTERLLEGVFGDILQSIRTLDGVLQHRHDSLLDLFEAAF